MDCMLEILNKCLKDSNLETVTKAELRKKYLEKTGLTKLPVEVKSQFTSAVNTAYLNYISAQTNVPTNGKINEDSEAMMDSSSEDEITSANVKEDIIADKFPNEVNDMQEGQSSDPDEKSLASYKNNGIKKSSNTIKKQRNKRTLSSSSEDEIVRTKSVQRNRALKKARKSRDLETRNHFQNTVVSSNDSDDEPQSVYQKKSKSFSASLNSTTKSKESEDKFHLKYAPKQTNNPLESDIHSNDSDDQPLTRFQKSNDFIRRTEKAKFEAKQKSNKYEFDVQSLNNSSVSEDEPLAKYKNSNDYVHSDEDSDSLIKKKLNSSKKHSWLIESTSGSEDEPVPTLINRKTNLLNKSQTSKHSSSESENESFVDCSKNKPIISDDSDEEPLNTLTKNSNSVSNSLKLKEQKNKKQNLKEKIFVESDDDAVLSNQKKEYFGDQRNSLISDTSEDEPLSNMRNKESKSSQKKEYFDKQRNSLISDTSEDEPLSNMRNKESKSKKKKEYFDKQRNSLISDTSEDEPLSNMKNQNSKSNLLNDSCTSKNSSSGAEIVSPSNYSKQRVDNSLDSDEEPVTTLTKKSKFMNSSLKSMKHFSDSEEEPLNDLNNKKTDNSSASEKEPDEKIVKKKDHCLKKLAIKRGKSKDECLKKKKCNNTDDDDDVNISNQKQEKSFNGPKNSQSDSSEDESLNRLSAEKSNMKQKSSESGSCSFADENEEHLNKKDMPSKKKETNGSKKQGKKRPSASENKIEHLKKYLRVSGIRITNYNKLFANCKSMKAKCEKLMSLLEKEGLKGRPTLEKCKKLRKKIETKKEIAELDMSNILKVEGGRPKRSICSDTTNCKSEDANSTSIKRFSRLQDIFDSEESD